MKISREWLQTFFSAGGEPTSGGGKPLPSAQELADALTFHAFEIESAEGDILDVKVTPNRGHDCLSHRGIAKEISAILNIPLSNDPLRNDGPRRSIMEPKTDTVSAQIEDTELCLRYIAGYIKGVEVGPSPEWLVTRLEAMGQKSINNVIDAANFVMFNIGQPLHAFDADKIKGPISIRQLKKGDQLNLLKTTIQIKGGDVAGWNRNIAQLEEKGALAICDEGGPIALAGIKGGRDTAVTENTTSIILEAANFDGRIIRWASKHFGIRTDSSQRFEQVISPELAAYGMRAAADLIVKLAGGELVGFADAYPKPQAPSHVVLHAAQPSKVLGVEISKETIRDVFSRLDFAFEEKGDEFVVTPPFERLDIKIPEDLIEEIARIIGYEKIPAKELPPFGKKPEVNQNFATAERVREDLIAKGYSEVYTSVFADKGERAVLNKVDSVKPYLRANLTDGLAEALKKNVQNKDLLGLKEIKLFEIGTVWKEGQEIVVLCLADSKGVREQLLPMSGDTISRYTYEDLPVSITERYRSFSRYPSITRDIALWVPLDTKVDEVANVIAKAFGDFAVRLDLFDEFKKDNKTSYAFRLVFQSFEKTLTDDEINAQMEKVYEAVKSKGWTVR
ncbi:MAG: phenylalanine--tRNA ligase subunit beta [Patescibacteria group bacterium]